MNIINTEQGKYSVYPQHKNPQSSPGWDCAIEVRLSRVQNIGDYHAR